MRKSNYTEEQIAFALKQAELGTAVAEVCRKMGVSEATFFRWKQKYGGWVRRSSASCDSSRREHEAEAAGRRPQPGQGHAAGGSGRKA
jgi:transposase-like protein